MQKIITGQFIGLSVLLMLYAALSAQHTISDQANSWWVYQGNHRFTERWGLHTEFQARRSNWIVSPLQYQVRIAGEYYIHNGPRISAGYSYIRTYPYGALPVSYPFDEHRIYQQLIFTHKFQRFNFEHRYRLEQRFLEQKIANPDTLNPEPAWLHDKYIFRNRLRYRFMITVPLSRKEMEDNTLFLFACDEIFINLGKDVGKNVFDQNRLTISLGWRFNPNFNIQLGYLNQYLLKSNGTNVERNHTLQVFLQYNFDFRKKK